MEIYQRHGPAFVNALLSPFPPVRAGLRLAGQFRRGSGLDFARLALMPARRLAEEYFGGEGGALLLAGNALHADLSPETAGSGLFGWLMCALGQYVGFPVPEGGAGELTSALVRRLGAAGGQVRCGAPVVQVIVRNGGAVGVRTAHGEEIPVRRAVLADVSAPQLYGNLLADTELPRRLVRDLGRFEWDPGTVKVDWALSAPIPWSAPDARQAGTVHIADSVDELSRWAADLATRTVPARPFLLVGQQSMTDPTRQPEGAETAWAYTHVPRSVERDAAGEISGRWDGDDEAAMVERIEQRMEDRAPGFRQLIIGRHVFTPPSLQAANANLDGGAINGGTAQLHQQLVFRPTPGSGRPGTCVSGLYLASSSAHPGGGVHGACGSNAAHAALAATRVRPVRRVSGLARRRRSTTPPHQQPA
jgi:phytoene dehydrogenase-like protein